MSETPAGRELDALVAEKVMGWKAGTVEHFASIPDTEEHASTHGLLPRYSTDMNAAWEIVRALQKRGYTLALVQESTNVHRDRWWARFTITFDDLEPVHPDRGWRSASAYVDELNIAASVAICRAALEIAE